MKKLLLVLPIAFVVPVLLSCGSISNAITDFFISDEQEIDMGNKFKAQIDADTKNYPPYKATDANHTAVINYVNQMGQKIVSAQKDRKIAFTFDVLADTSINAFAIPGGHVYVNVGLLRAATSGAEVAGVMAHEIGHVTMRHGAKQMMSSSALGIAQTILFGSDTASISAAVTQMVAGMLFLKYSRDDENQADSCAVAYGVAAGYNPYGFRNFFYTLKARYPSGPTSYDIFSTHPNTDDRITHTQSLISKIDPTQSSTDTTGMHTAEYLVIKGKI